MKYTIYLPIWNISRIVEPIEIKQLLIFMTLLFYIFINIFKFPLYFTTAGTEYFAFPKFSQMALSSSFVISIYRVLKYSVNK